MDIHCLHHLGRGGESYDCSHRGSGWEDQLGHTEAGAGLMARRFPRFSPVAGVGDLFL